MRKKNLNNIIFAVVIMMLTGCAGLSSGPVVGPQIDSSDSAQANHPYDGVRLDVIVPVFDPGIPEDPDDYEDEGVWPELRRAEANRFAIVLKNELQNTNVLGDIYVTPTSSATGDLYVIGKIVQSNGEDIEIDVTVVDISGEHWMNRSYEHRVKEHFSRDLRSKGKDPYQPVFQRVAEDVAAMIKDRPNRDLATLRHIAELRFARTFSEESFSEYIEEDGQSVTLMALPDRDDPMLARTRAIRVQDGLFMDRIQSQYAAFAQRTDSSYAAWQEHAMLATKGRREADSAALWDGVIGAGLAVLGVAAIVASVYTNSPVASVGSVVGGTVAVIGGISLLEKSFKNSAEGEVHADALSELGESLNIEVAPQNIELEGTTTKLTGNANEQFRQWRAFLRKLYVAERIPDTKIDLRPDTKTDIRPDTKTDLRPDTKTDLR